MKRYAKFLIVAALLVGCDSDDPVQQGEVCPPPSFASNGISYIFSKTCTETSCDLGNFSNSFKNNICPKEFPKCLNEGDEYFCAEKNCFTNQHIYDGECVDNSLDHCGSHDTSCEKLAGWVDGTCEYGKCVASKCRDGYELNKGVCEGTVPVSVSCSDNEHAYDGDCESDSVEHCGTHEYACAGVKGWASGECRNKVCVATSCQSGFEVVGGACQAKSVSCLGNEHVFENGCEQNSMENCGSHGNDCTKLEGWGSGSCLSGMCSPTSCSDGYSYDVNANACVANAECAVGTTHHMFGDVCEENSTENCGAHDNNCTKLTGWLTGVCEKGVCIAKTCVEGFRVNANGVCEEACDENQHRQDGECQADTMTDCGAYGNNCLAMDGWKEGSCVSGKCVAEACQDGFDLLEEEKICILHSDCPDGDKHLYESECEDNTVENCGEHGFACADTVEGWLEGTCPHGKCTASKCKEGFCLSNGVCVDGKADVNACGVAGEACKACKGNENCADGVCAEGVCGAGTHVYGTECEEDDDAHCGSHDKACSEHFACVNANCVCASGFHANGTACEKDDNNHCGSHDTVCPTNSTCSGGTCVCSAGYHIKDSTCVKDTTDNCGKEGNKCPDKPDNASSVACKDGACVITCRSNYHVYEATCEENTAENCGAHGAECNVNTVSLSANVSCTTTTGVCKVSSCVSHATVSSGTCVCSSGYHKYENTCEENSDAHCGDHNTECSYKVVPLSTSAKCSTSGVCEATKCESGTTLSGGKCICKTGTHLNEKGDACEEDSLEHCGSYEVSCNAETVPFGKELACEKGQCVAKSCVDNATRSTTNQTCSCNNKSHAYGNTCELNDDTNCGEHSRACDAKASPLSSAFKCSTAGNCQATTCVENAYMNYTMKTCSCKNNYHVYDNTCEENSDKHCGGHDEVCDVSKVANSTSVNCTSGKCVATKCESGYRVVGGKCQK